VTTTSERKRYRQLSGRPTNKVIATGLAGALTTILIWLLDTYVLAQPMPAEVVAAVTTVIAVLVAYIVPPTAADQITQV
jgi:fluoride ion exporter CrcB/FEX